MPLRWMLSEVEEEDTNGLESALAEPLQTFDGRDLYPTLWDKVAAMGRSLISNHPFVDGNKRVGFAAMMVKLDQAGYDIISGADESVQMTLAIASGTVDWRTLSEWLQAHSVKRATF